MAELIGLPPEPEANLVAVEVLIELTVALEQGPTPQNIGLFDEIMRIYGSQPSIMDAHFEQYQILKQQGY